MHTHLSHCMHISGERRARCSQTPLPFRECVRWLGARVDTPIPWKACKTSPKIRKMRARFQSSESSRDEIKTTTTNGGVVNHLENVMKTKSPFEPMAEKENIQYFYSIARVWKRSEIPGPLPKIFHFTQPDEKQHGIKKKKQASKQRLLHQEKYIHCSISWTREEWKNQNQAILLGQLPKCKEMGSGRGISKGSQLLVLIWDRTKWLTTLSLWHVVPFQPKSTRFQKDISRTANTLRKQGNVTSGVLRRCLY